ncbi:hypothetical protein LPJ64_000342 [Coemansia asiatica]|uniref:GATA-type domain-containing protein n=1 Tax=Coemansia asiatica TaxID=1052880 RepID=A0A9W7XS61_9FUNG|nr:hypothetical protein LPJ64_000342 [Coemansia asiatica]
MTVNEKKRTAEQLLELSMAAHREAATANDQQQQQQPQPQPRGTRSHPCFWSVLHGESLNFVFVSASLHSFLGADRAAAMTNQSLFDFIHPDEATRARRDLVDTFVSKSLFGSGIRCRLRRFDLERLGGFQHIFRRASESHILHQSHHHAQHVHEAFERKMSLPIIPDMARMRSVGHTNHAFHHHHHHHMPLQSHPPSTNPMHQPMPKRLRTILEDSIGPLAAEQRGDDKTSALNNSARAGIKIKIKDTSDQTCSGSSGGGSSEEQARGCEDVARCCISHIDSVATNVADMNNGLGDGGCNNSEYLIANIGLYLVSSRLSIMVCHYEDSPKSRGLLPLCSADNLSTGPQTIQCDCAASALAMTMADAERTQLLLSQIHKLDTIGSFHSPAIHPPLLPATIRCVKNISTISSGSGKGPAAGIAGAAGNISSRHVQIYSIESQLLLCAFPEEGYQKVYGRAAADSAAQGASLHDLWKSCTDKKAASHAQALLQSPGVPSPDPFHLELQIRASESSAHVEVQCILFRWGRLLFVCQQARSDSSPDSSVVVVPSRTGISARLAANTNANANSNANVSAGAGAGAGEGAGAGTGGGSGGTTTPVAEVESALSNYNIQTPPSENPLRISATAELGFRLDQNCSLSTSHPHLPATLSSYPGPGASTSTNTSTSTSAGSTFASVQQQQQQQQQTQQPQHRPMARFLPAVHQQSFGHLSAVPESRPFSIPRAPASVAANLPVRPPVTLTPPDTSVPPRRQSSYTLPPVKSFEERRFSYPIQALNGDTSRPQPPPPPPPPSQPHSQHQSLGHSSGHSSGPGTSSSAIGGPNSASTAGISVRGSPVSMTGGPGTATFSPGGRLLELRQRAMFGANLRIGGAMSSAKSMGELSSTQPTPTISPLTASIVQHTPVSLSPAPQTQPHSASSVASGSFQVNMYPPSDTPESWRWSQGTAPATSHHRQQQQQQQQQNQQQQHLHHHPHQYHQHHMLLQKHGAQSFSAVSSQKPPPPLPISRAANHPLHYGALHASIQDHYQSPISSVVASPSIVGTPSSAPATQQRINGDPDKKMCKSCGTDTSPEWRKGPTGHKT